MRLTTLASLHRGGGEEQTDIRVYSMAICKSMYRVAFVETFFYLTTGIGCIMTTNI